LQHRPLQTPLLHCPFAVQRWPAGKRHWLDAQVLPPVHTLPHEPQFELLLVVLTHAFEQQDRPPAQHVPEHAVCPAGQGWQSVPPALQVPLGQRVGDGVMHCPLALHDEPAVFMPPAQDCPAPHAVPGVWFVPLSAQTAAPVEQPIAPWWHGLAVGVHAAPELQGPQVPLPLHTIPAPQDVPGAALAFSTHIEAPVEQDVVPVRHGLPATGHVMPLAHAAQAPAEVQTMPRPHIVPGGRFVPLSVHVGVAVEQSSVPA
jgi:hypothetical protein